MNNMPNIEFLYRDYDQARRGKERAIQFYSKTFETIKNKYWKWRMEYLENKKSQINEKIAFQQSVVSNQFIGEHNVAKRKNRIENLKDEINFINIELETRHYPIKARLLKVVERGVNRVSSWWKKLVSQVIVQKPTVMYAADSEQVTENKSDSSFDSQFDLKPEDIRNLVERRFGDVNSESRSNETQKVSDHMNDSDSVYHLNREQLAALNNDSYSNFASDSISESIEDSNNYSQEENNMNFGSEQQPYVPIVPPVKEDLTSNADSYNPNEFNSSPVTMQNVDDMKFTQSMPGLDSSTNNIYEEFTKDSATASVGNDDRLDTDADQDIMEFVAEYKRNMQEQDAKKKDMDDRFKAAMSEITLRYENAKAQLAEAQQKKEEARETNQRLRSLLENKLTSVEQQIQATGQRHQEELNRAQNEFENVSSATEEINSSTARVMKSNAILKEMCMAVGIDDFGEKQDVVSSVYGKGSRKS